MQATHAAGKVRRDIRGLILFDTIRPFVPTPLWVLARRTHSYSRRILTWAQVMRQLRGVSPGDRRTIRGSATRGLWQSLRKLDEWQDPILPADAEVTVRGVGRFRVRAHSDDLYHVLPAREASILDYLSTHLKPGELFVDAGANIGFYTVHAARLVGPAGRVVAVEMMPDTAAALRGHVALNALDNVEIVEQALSDCPGQTVTASVTPGKYGRASIAHGAAPGDEERRVEVETTTLDAVLADSGQVRVMKMDLEGAEYPALQGASAVLRNIEAVIFEELDSDRRAAGLLEQAGFRLRRLDGNNLVAERRS